MQNQKRLDNWIATGTNSCEVNRNLHSGELDVVPDIQILASDPVPSSAAPSSTANQGTSANSDSQNSIGSNVSNNSTTNSQDSRPPDESRRRSNVYDHFTWISNKEKFKCNYCVKEYSVPKKGGTGTLTNHMNRKHSSKMTVNQGTIKSHFAPTEKPTPTEKQEITRDGFLDKLVEFIVRTDQPFLIVEEEAFRNFLEYVSGGNPTTIPPGRKTIRERISKCYKTKLEQMKTMLQMNKAKINFIIDCWTSANGHSFQGVVATWIDNEWKLRIAVLDLTRINGRHTGENLAKHFAKVLNLYNLWDKLLTVTTDNASNMDSFFDNFEPFAKEKNSTFNKKNYRVRCLAHILNLACKAAMKKVDTLSKPGEDEEEDDEDDSDIVPSDLVDKIRKCVKKMRRSQEKRDMLRRQCQAEGITSTEVILDNATRWNSTLNMMERIVKIKSPFQIAVAQFPELASLKLTEEEWTRVEQLIDLLEMFRGATLLFSANEPTLSDTLAIYEVLFTHLEKYMPSNSTATTYRNEMRTDTERMPLWLQDAATAGWNKLTKYYPTADGLAYKVATVLNPKFKDKWYAAVGWRREWISACKTEVRRLWTSEYKTQDIQTSVEEPPRKRSKNIVQERILEQMQNIATQTTSPEDELTRYLRDPVVSPQALANYKDSLDRANILTWWKSHEEQYPNLSRMAADFLSILGTGVPVERLFSSATDTLTHRRYRMSAATMNECLCLKSWFALEKESKMNEILAAAITLTILGSAGLEQIDEDGQQSDEDEMTE